MYVSGCSNNEGAGTHYQQKKDVESLYAVLYSQVKNGCSIDEVHQLLGQEDPSMSERGNSAVKKLAEKTPRNFPDGFQANDHVLAYSTNEGFIVFLQFRNGQLINYNPDEFSKKPNKAEVVIIGD
jgi:hypothetical protein